MVMIIGGSIRLAGVLWSCVGALGCCVGGVRKAIWLQKSLTGEHAFELLFEKAGVKVIANHTPLKIFAYVLVFSMKVLRCAEQQQELREQCRHFWQLCKSETPYCCEYYPIKKKIRHYYKHEKMRLHELLKVALRIVLVALRLLDTMINLVDMVKCSEEERDRIIYRDLGKEAHHLLFSMNYVYKNSENLKENIHQLRQVFYYLNWKVPAFLISETAVLTFIHVIGFVPGIVKVNEGVVERLRWASGRVKLHVVKCKRNIIASMDKVQRYVTGIGWPRYFSRHWNSD